MTRVIALGLVAETTLFVLAGVLFLRRLGYTIAEAGAGGILLFFMAVSLSHQVDIFIGSPWPGLVLEGGALTVVLANGGRGWHLLVGFFRTANGLIRQERFPVLIIAGGWAVMAILASFGWGQSGFQSLWAERFGWFHRDLSLLAALHPIAPLNAPALFYHTSRFGLDPGACGFGVLAHMAVGLSTYALARRYAWPPMALTITLMVVSMPRMVRLAMHPCAELISVAAIMVCVLLLYRLVEQHMGADLHFFLLCLCFSIHFHPMSLALVLVMVLLLGVVMMRRHGWLLCRELVVAQPIPTALVVLLSLALVQVPVFALNLGHGNPLLGTGVVFDTDGIIGATANLIRYLFISIDPTEAVRIALVWLIGLDLRQVMTGLYRLTVVSLFGRSGASAPFMPIFSGSGPAGFGPVAALLVLPAMIHAALRGPRRLKALSVAWGGYLYLAALIFAWTSDNLIVLSPFYAANGFMVAFFLPPWRLRRRGMRLLQVLCVLLLVGSLIGYR